MSTPISPPMGPPTRTKPYLQVPIEESGDPLVPIPVDLFAYQTPHAYVALGAPYGDRSPYFVREPVLQALIGAQAQLQETHPHWQIFIFDALRPVAVQEFMVHYAFQEYRDQRGWSADQLTAMQEAQAWEFVLQLWAMPSLDLTTPPPHSTGAAVDVTLYDRNTQQRVDMGSPIDELSVRSHPNHFVNQLTDPNLSESERQIAQQAHHHRQLLHQIMTHAGFQRHLGEWWHFCLGDQMWAWLTQQQHPQTTVVARYGRYRPDNQSP